MDDFLYILKLQLEGRLSDEQITDQMHIYEDYIQEQLAGGKTMEQVMRKLGDPEKVADMIVEHYEKLERQQQRENIGNMTADEINANVQNPEHGFHAEFIENEGPVISRTCPWSASPSRPMPRTPPSCAPSRMTSTPTL